MKTELKLMVAVAVYFILGLAAVSYGTWDATLPLGSESLSLADDRLREIKEDVEEALSYEGYFPSTDTANPVFVYTPSTGTTSQRPYGSKYAPAGRIFINTTSKTLEMSNGDNTWTPVDLVPSSGITAVKLASTSITAPLQGGHSNNLKLNIATTTFGVLVGTTTHDVLTSTYSIEGGSLALKTGSFGTSRFRANQNVTVAVVQNSTVVAFPSEQYDTSSEFDGSTFTAITSGDWLINIHLRSGYGSGYCTLKLITSNRTYEQIAISNNSKCNNYFTRIIDMDAGDTARVELSNDGATNFTTIDGDDSVANVTSFEAFKLR